MSCKITEITAENSDIFFQLHNYEKLATLFLTHISEEEEPYDEKEISQCGKRYIKNMLSPLHGMKLKLVESEDFRLIFKYRCEENAENKYKSDEMMRVIVLYKDKIVLIYTENNINLLETLNNFEEVLQAIKLTNTYGQLSLSINEDEPDVDWMEVDEF